jgi:16S rRNA (adenine1518-N6/adenine1519-N6)-dimethyltransferase
LNHTPRKRFGQNFLTDRFVIDQIAMAIDPRSDQHIVEIGPGQAALTKALLPHCGQFTAIEIDRDLVAPLRRRFADQANFQLIEADALRFDYAHFGDETIRLVGNLPYNISTPLLFHLLESRAQIQDFHVMLQKEVALRMCAGPGSKTYGRLSVAVALAAKAEVLFEVPPEAFYPAPKVQSCIVRLQPRRNTLPWAQLDIVLKAAFAARRKTLRNALRNCFEAQQLIDLDVDPTQRPEQLTPQDYLRLALHLPQAEL